MGKWIFVLGLVLSFNVYAQTSGSCAANGAGNTCSWSYDALTNTLTISGEGEMKNYNYSPSDATSGAPWFLYKDEIKNIVIENGITNIGEAAFSGTKVEKIDIPNSVTSIGTYAFLKTKELKNIELPNNLQTIGHAAFYQSGLISIDIPDSVQTIHSSAFAMKNLQELKISDSTDFINTFGTSAFNDGGSVYPSKLHIVCKGAKQICEEKIKENMDKPNHPQIETIFNVYRANRRIYTIDEAVQDSGKVNTIRIKYK